MVSVNITVDDSSPLILYQPLGSWIDVPSNDSLLQSYSGLSAHSTFVQGATATIFFNGTGIRIYGGKRPNYGTYTFSVDGQNITSANSSSPTPAFSQLLGQASGLPDGLHMSVLTCTGSNATIDIDWLEFEAQIGPVGATISNATIDDSDPRINYSGSDWFTNNSTSFINDTLHFTETAGASATLSFSGDAVAMYGTVSPDHADIRVNLDGNVVRSFSAGSGGATERLHTQTLLYFTNNLSLQQHTLAIIADPEPGTGAFIDLDAFIIYSASGNSNQSGNDTINTTQVSTPTIVGAVLGGVFGGALILVFFLCCIFRHRDKFDVPPAPLTPALPMQEPHRESLLYRWTRRSAPTSNSATRPARPDRQQSTVR